ncbi:Lcl domain-containing protein [Photobacterium sp. Hal280]|uniref:Lcl domain-containing protein n=1 Tax=Photobacterium sp. Hal280 TaxID=3035163 RepID=UPI00301E0761
MVAARSTATTALHLAAPAARENAHTLINGITTLVVGEMLSGASLNTAIASVKNHLKSLGMAPPSDLLAGSDDAALAELDGKVLSLVSLLSRRHADYGVVVAGAAKGLGIYGAALMAETLDEEQLEKILALGQMSVKQLNDTGMVQHLNLSTGTLTDEPDPGAPGQDASFGLDVTEGGFKFTKLDAKGQPLPEDSAIWHCVQDERSGLVWEIKPDDAGSFRDKHRLFALETETIKPHADELALASCSSDQLEACTTQAYSQKLNESALCGKTNWRLPTMHEQYDLLDFSETATDANNNIYGLTAAFFNDLWIGSDDLPYGFYWSSTLLRTDPGYTSGKALTYLTQMTGADGGTGLGEITAYQALCVPGEECLSPNVMAVRMVAE